MGMGEVGAGGGTERTSCIGGSVRSEASVEGFIIFFKQVVEIYAFHFAAKSRLCRRVGDAGSAKEHCEAGASVKKQTGETVTKKRLIRPEF